MAALIWTRAQADWEQDKKTALMIGVAPEKILHVPCITFEPVPVRKEVNAANYVIFTSSNAVRFAMADERLAQVIRAAVKIFAIGSGTAQALTDAGLGATPGISGKDAKELADQILAKGEGGSFLIPMTKIPAFDLAGYLTKNGRKAESVVCYETHAKATTADGRDFSEDEAQAFAAQLARSPGVVCFASPSSVRGFDNVLRVRENELGRSLIPVAIGKTTMNEVLQYFPQCKVADTNSTSDLMSCAAAVLSELERENQ